MAAKKKSAAKSKGTRQSTLKKRKASPKAAPHIMSRKTLWGGIAVIGVLWAGAWFFLSDADTKTAQWMSDQTMSVTRAAGYKVENILVEGRKHSDADAILAIVNVREGDPIFRFKPVEAKAQIEKIGWVKSVRVERRLPNTVYINLKERTPIALWQHDDSLYLIDSEGERLTQENLAAFKDLLMVSGKGAQKAVPALNKMLSSYPDLIANVDHAERIDNRRWDVVLKNSKRIKLPAKASSEALAHVMARQTEDQILDKESIMDIDARYKGRLIVRTKLGKVQDYKSGIVDAGVRL